MIDENREAARIRLHMILSKARTWVLTWKRKSIGGGLVEEQHDLPYVIN